MPSTPAIRLMLMLCCLAFFHCANTSKLNGLLIEHREYNKSYAQQVEALSRENTILFKAKTDLEKENARLKKTIETIRAQMETNRAQHAIEKENYSTFYESTRKKNAEYEQRILLSQEKFAQRINDLNDRNEKITDFLSHRIDSLSAFLSFTRDSLAHEKTLLAKKTLDYEKELYSLGCVKKDLFDKLQKQERTIQQLISNCLQSPKEKDTGPVKNR